MIPLSFLAPAFLLGALSAAVPIVLHLLRHEAAPSIPFSAVRFLRHAPVEERRRRRLRDLLLLALRVVAVVLLAVGFARPYLAAGRVSGDGVTVIAVDVSFSLGAPGQMAKVRASAREAIRAAPGTHRVAVVAFSDGTDVLVAPTRDRGAALAAIERLEAGYGATRYRQALAAAGALLDGAPGRIVLVTDLQRTGWETDDGGTLPNGVTVELRDVGMPKGNLAVAAIRREPGGTSATVINAGSAPRAVRAALAVDGQPRAVATGTVPPGGATDLKFPVALPETVAASVTVEDGEGPPADDTRHAVFAPPAPLGITLVTATGQPRDALYLERALVAGEDEHRVALDTVAVAAVATLRLETLRATEVVFLLATRGLDRKGVERLATYVRDGGGVVVVAGPYVEPGPVAELLGVGVSPDRPATPEQWVGTISLAPVDLRHPVFRSFGPLAANLTQVRFRRTRQLVSVADGLVVARFSDGREAVVEYRRGRGRVLLFGSDLNNEWNDFPLHPTFAPFVHELARYLAGARPTEREWLVGTLPPGVPAKPGIVRLTATGRPVAVNVNLGESDLRRTSSEEFMTLVARLKGPTAGASARGAAAEEAHQQFWWYTLLAATVVLVAESLVARRAA